MTRKYRVGLQLSLHDAPNPLDPIGATDWGQTRASDFVHVEVDLAGEVITREQSTAVVATRAVADGGVWALFVDRWGPAKPVWWAALVGGVDAGATFELPAGHDHLTIADSFIVRNVATSHGAAR